MSKSKVPGIKNPIRDSEFWARYGLLKKTGLLIAAILLIILIWYSGAEQIYARFLVNFSNFILDTGGSDTRLGITEENETHLFIVHTFIQGQMASYTQVMGALLLPTVMLIAWQVFMAFFLRFKRWFKYTLINIGLFFAAQVLFLLLLSAYHTSQTASYIYDMMMDSFYIIGLLIILVDNISHPVFLSILKTGGTDSKA